MGAPFFFLAPFCLVTQPPKRGLGEKSGHIHMQVDRPRTFRTTLGPTMFRDGGLHREEPELGGSLDHPEHRAEKWDGSRHHSTHNPCKENK